MDIAMTAVSGYMAFAETLAEQGNNALWQKATLCRENLLNQAEQNVDFGIY
ncbi:MAG: hypothetical protein MR878_01390 [Campylobacter sp.]|uniref:hypothetical protein n=1 Tax=Campylobacter sp. TaxID=205 RepID=UPI002AA779CD|nr:hypothetical protein [Campylobacter sp.]MCI7014026.1 hypothetical protein [Campylobacter sp.]